MFIGDPPFELLSPIRLRCVFLLFSFPLNRFMLSLFFPPLGLFLSLHPIFARVFFFTLRDTLASQLKRPSLKKDTFFSPLPLLFPSRCKDRLSHISLFSSGFFYFSLSQGFYPLVVSFSLLLHCLDDHLSRRPLTLL